ncbi:MAG TPA: formimidoylglutamase [Cyclobacteriaceae bacterium]|nr:formimidoylglutamase [Cyclobacteriaceae bacterium]
MDLSIFFSPLDESVYSSITAPSSVLKNIRIFSEKMPDYKDAHVAILGVNETRGAGHHAGKNQAPDEIRKKFYQLKKGSGAYRIVDLGNLNNGIDLDETYVRLSEVCRILLEHNVLPVILGGTHDLDYGQYWAYERLEKLVSLLNIDAFLDLEDKHGVSQDRRHIHKILLHEPNFLLSYTHLAYQSYLIDPSSISVLEKLYFEAFRIGQMRTNLQEMEPAIRQADLLSFDITSIRSADAPGSDRAQPFGLSGEDACQICWYAGMNEKLSSLGIYGYSPDLDDAHKKTASVIATMVWYFIEGFYHRKNERDFKSNDFTKYTVSLPVEPELLIFYKSKFTERWWMEIPSVTQTPYSRNSIVPCSYNDYLAATKGDVPERYITAMGKM